MLSRALPHLRIIGSVLTHGNITGLRPILRLCHSSKLLIRHRDMDVKFLPAMEVEKNYMYLIIDKKTKECGVVDPVKPEQVVAEVKKEGLKLTSVLTTHHHWDHAGGNEELISMVGKIPVYGENRVKALTNETKDGDTFTIGSLKVECMVTPCHTKGHTCYLVTGPSGEDPAVFTGDTLFVGGCGKFFDGTAAQMYTALIERLGSLDPNTKVYCGHEYTVNNLKYAQHVEPDNEDIKAKMKWAVAQRSKDEPTIPSTIAEEKLYNPFMRVREPTVQSHAGKTKSAEVMDFLRTEKNNFKSV